jgi:anthraniloyl-CoA monooxygenase
VVAEQEPEYGRMYQAPFADMIRNEVGIATVVAGNITTADQCNTLIGAGRTDLVALARPLMNDPHFMLAAAAHYDQQQQFWPPQYLSGKSFAHAQAAKTREEQHELRVAAKPPAPAEALAIAMARGDLLQH